MDDETLHVKATDVDVKQTFLPESIFEGSDEHFKAKQDAEGGYLTTDVSVLPAVCFCFSDCLFSSSILFKASINLENYSLLI
jgi:hypothetical protein